MNILTVNKSKEAVADSKGSSYISKSGIYDVTIKFASIDVSKSGAKSMNFNFDYNGNDVTVYGPYITNSKDEPLDIGLGLVRDKLGTIAGVDGDLTIETEEHAVGRDKKLQEFAVVAEYSGLPIKVRLQEEYSRYNGDITKKLVIKNFFREDGASAEEIINATEIGKRLAYETENLADKVTYSESKKGAGDAPTSDEVAAWKEAKKSGAAPTKAAPKIAPSAGAKLFGSK